MGQYSPRGGRIIFDICQCLKIHFKIKEANFVSGYSIGECFDIVIPDTDICLLNDTIDNQLPGHLH